MKNVVGLALISSTLMSQAFALGPKVIYGEDDRLEVYEALEAHQILARSTAVLINKGDISSDALRPEVVQLKQTTLKQWLDSAEDKTAKKMFSPEVSSSAQAGITFCEDTRFIHQANPGMCSGFLIAPDLIVTAGHCVKLDRFCEDYRWVFDFKVNKDSKKAGVDQPADTVYSCKKVVSSGLATIAGLDYGVIKLDRRVKDRSPLEIRTEQKVADAQSVLVIGGPSGLPTKVAAGANVRGNSHPNYFVTNLDTFQGNSGSAVFNSQTNVVEGILVRGEEDYKFNTSRQCIEANLCATTDCRGEDVSRILSIPELAAIRALNAAAISGKVSDLNRILATSLFWVDINLQDGQSSLIKASAAGKNASIKVLLAKGADVNLKDALGNTALHALAVVLKGSNAAALETLLEAKANIEAVNDLGETPLLVAGNKGNARAVKLLIKAGANKNAVATNGQNVLARFIKSNDHLSVIELADMGVETKAALKNASLQMKRNVLLRKGVDKQKR